MPGSELLADVLTRLLSTYSVDPPMDVHARPITVPAGVRL